jgi:protein Mpv17
MKRVALDQLVFTPVFMPMVLSSVMLIEGRGADIPSTLKREYFQTLQKNWMLWTPAQMINFRYVPPHLQVLFGNCVAALWNGFLSFVAHHNIGSALVSSSSGETDVVSDAK